jgi:arylsulfatase A-like enzyme
MASGQLPTVWRFRALDDTNALPVWLQQSGYRTAILGKYLNGYTAAGLEGYVPRDGIPGEFPVQGTYNYRSWTLNVDGEQVAYRGRYQTDFVATEAKAIVQRYAPQRNPYFLWAGLPRTARWCTTRARRPGPPGTPNVSPRYRDVYAQLPLPAKASINESDVSDKPHFVQDSPIRSVEVCGS